MKYVRASCLANPLLTRYVFLAFRAGRGRPVALCLSRYDVLISLPPSSASTTASAPSTPCVSTATTRPGARRLGTVA